MLLFVHVMPFNLFLSSASYTKCFKCFTVRELRKKVKVVDKLGVVTSGETKQKGKAICREGEKQRP